MVKAFLAPVLNAEKLGKHAPPMLLSEGRGVEGERPLSFLFCISAQLTLTIFNSRVEQLEKELARLRQEGAEREPGSHKDRTVLAPCDDDSNCDVDDDATRSSIGDRTRSHSQLDPSYCHTLENVQITHAEFLILLDE